jgi:hypothetical protein
MTRLGANGPPAQPNLGAPDARSEKPEGEYRVGRGNPPLHTRFKPGQSGNPSGRRKGSRNLKSELEEIMSKPITIREGETERKLSLLAANVFVHGVKGAKGDARSTALFLNYAYQLGYLEQEDTEAIESADRGGQDGNAVPLTPARTSRPSDTLFEHLDLNLLSQDEQIELSRLAEVIDSAADDITALSAGDFEQVKYIVNKGRGKGITAH